MRARSEVRRGGAEVGVPRCRESKQGGECRERSAGRGVQGGECREGSAGRGVQGRGPCTHLVAGGQRQQHPEGAGTEAPRHALEPAPAPAPAIPRQSPPRLPAHTLHILDHARHRILTDSRRSPLDKPAHLPAAPSLPPSLPCPPPIPSFGPPAACSPLTAPRRACQVCTSIRMLPQRK